MRDLIERCETLTRPLAAHPSPDTARLLDDAVYTLCVVTGTRQLDAGLFVARQQMEAAGLFVARRQMEAALRDRQPLYRRGGSGSPCRTAGNPGLWGPTAVGRLPERQAAWVSSGWLSSTPYPGGSWRSSR
ncbi:DUF5133 domain-containing protein [Streptomyces chartreusis]|uniref:DUF5133 domain-containing protein n=1 Tax=Streptomyces chartreusis TaxID=1969 RepID=UPI0036355B46